MKLTSLPPVNWLVLVACEFVVHKHKNIIVVKKLSPFKKRKLSGLNLLELTV